jgi:HAD superfamily hydrolase (TIGR01509 family)
VLSGELSAVCFDIGGVLVEMPRGPLAQELAAVLDRDVEWVRDLLIEHGKMRRIEVSALAEILAGRTRFDRRDRVEAALKQRVADVAEPRFFPDALPVLEQLRSSGWRICMLTNAVGTPGPRPCYYSYAEVVAHSWEIGYCKPELAAFREVERLMDLPPHQIVKVGDSPRFDIAGARRAGWATVHVARDGAASTVEADEVIGTLAALPDLLPVRPCTGGTGGR